MFLAPTPTLSGKLVSIAYGNRGVMQTISKMREYVKQFKHDVYIRGCALNTIFLIPEKHDVSECESVFNFVRDNIRYTKDVLGIETLSTPDITMQIRQGDCDDKSCLLATMFESIGYPTRFIIAGYSDPKNFEHVYCQVLCGDSWINCDSTENYPFGWCPPDPVKIAIEKV